ncbi:DNA cytosine methyltransferase [Thermodesulfobacteriota bacterium]
MKKALKFLDVFTGGGGLSEGFIRAGYSPVAHVEVNKAACYTLKTRMAYHWLKNHDRVSEYYDYLHGRISRSELYDLVPGTETASVINAEIGRQTIPDIFKQIDGLLRGQPLDLIVGGPPCQAYSMVGRNRDKKRMQGDKRNYLYIYYAKFLRKYRPRYFVFENVIGLLSAKSEEGKLYFNEMRDLFQKAGYETEYRILSTENYGVPQTRRRIILVGRKGKKTGFYPEPAIWQQNETIDEIFQDLPSLQAGEGSPLPCRTGEYSGKYLYTAGIKNAEVPVTWHVARPHTEQDLEIYRIAVQKWNEHKERLDYNDLPERLKTHKNRRSFLDRFKVVASDLPTSHTVVAHISQDGHFYIHPDINQNRSLSPREAARLQTFPDDYFFESSSGIHGRTPAFSQIGNAVPVMFAQKIAEKMMEIW